MQIKFNNPSNLDKINGLLPGRETKVETYCESTKTEGTAIARRSNDGDLIRIGEEGEAWPRNALLEKLQRSIAKSK